MPGLYSWPHYLLWAVSEGTLTKLLMCLSVQSVTPPSPSPMTQLILELAATLAGHFDAVIGENILHVS